MITYQQEFLATCRVEAEPLLERHWGEARKRDGFDPDIDAYEQIEAAGALRIFTARRDGRLVGYVIFVLSRDLHEKEKLRAICDGIYLDPLERRGLEVANLIRFAESCLREDGASSVRVHNNADSRVGSLFSRFGYKVVETVHEKPL